MSAEPSDYEFDLNKDFSFLLTPPIGSKEDREAMGDYDWRDKK